MGALDDVDLAQARWRPAGTAPGSLRSRFSTFCSPVRMSRSRTRPFSSPMTTDPSPRATGEVLRDGLEVAINGHERPCFHRTFSRRTARRVKAKAGGALRRYGHDDGLAGVPY